MNISSSHFQMDIVFLTSTNIFSYFCFYIFYIFMNEPTNSAWMNQSLRIFLDCLLYKYLFSTYCQPGFSLGIEDIAVE